MTKVETKCAILEVLSKATEPMRPSDIGEIVGLIPIHAGKYLSDMLKSGLVQKPDKKKAFYEITDKGRQYLENPPEEAEDKELKESTQGKYTRRAHKGTTEDTTEDTTKDTTEDTTEETTGTVPSQSDLLRKEGELLGVGMKKGEIRLDTIIKWVQRTANLDDLNSVWNALTEMAVANDVKKRWIKLYAQDLPSQKIPDELKEKLESGQEDKVSTEAKAGEIAPKPKRFSLIGNDIIGDPEGDLFFKEALQERAQNLGAAPAEANTAATIIEALKVGPEMSTSLLTVLLPLLTKEPPKHDETAMMQLITAQQTASQSQMQMMQQMLTAAIEEKHKAELEGIKAMITTGQKPAETETLKEAFATQIDALKETIHQQQLDNERRERDNLKEQFERQFTELKQSMAAIAQGKSVDSKIGLMDKGVDKIAGELSGVRGDLKGFAQLMMAKGEPLPKPRSPQEKQRFADGLTKGIEKAEEAKKQAQELWGAR